MSKFYTLILLFFSGNFAYSQNEANNWFFGQRAGITFNSGAPVAVTTGQLNTVEGCSTISDASGNLLFYTDGIRVWNKNHTVMPNGNNLKGDPKSSQSGIIVPKPGSTTIYYIFTVDMQGGLAPLVLDADGFYNGFMYSEIDMTLNGGLGDVVVARKNIALRTPTTENLAAVRHTNKSDYWVVVHGTNDNNYYSYLITAAGVNTIPVVSSSGPVVGVTVVNQGLGANGIMKISPDGSKIASTHYDNKELILSDFNAATGVVSNSLTIPINFSPKSEAPYGVEFSNCNEYLYLTEVFIDTLAGGTWPLETRIWRFDLNAGSIPASKTLFQLIPNEYDGALQLAPDGKIYCAKIPRIGTSNANYSFGPGGNAIHAINNPRLASATFTNNAVNLAGRLSELGLPPFIATFFYNSTFTYANIMTGDTILCSGDSVQFKAVASAYDSVRWSFGDPVTGINNTSILLNPKHLFSSNGAFTVRFYKYLCGTRDSVVKIITVNQYPVVTNIFDTTICSGAVILDATAIPVTSYLWSTTAITPTISVSTAGMYKVTVSNKGCIRKDSMTLTVNTATAVSVNIVESINNICSGTSVTFNATPSSTGLSPSYQWYLNNISVGSNSTTYTSNSTVNNDLIKVVMTSSANCISGIPATSNTITMIIKPNPIVTVNSPNICNGQTASLIASGATTYSWTGGLGSTATPTTPVLTTTTSYTVTGTTNGCTGTAVSTIIVKSNPVVSVNSPNICNGQTASLTAGGATTYSWTGGLGSTATPTTPVLTTTTSYTVTGTTNGCTGTAVSTIIVKSNPVVSVNSPSICNGQTASLTAGGATTYSWTGGLGSTATPTTPVLTTTTSYTVTGSTGGCTGTAVATVSVNPNLVISVNSPNICNGQTASLTAGGATTYSWTGGLGSTATPTTPVLTTTTLYTVTGTTNGCTGTAVATVSVNPNLVITVNSPSICNGQTASLTASGATTYSWTGGLSATSNPTTPALTTTTTYTVTGTTSGCTGTAVATVSMNPNLVITVNSPNICNGQTASLTASGATTYSWTGGLAAISNPTTPVLTNTTTYTVTGLTNGCSGTAIATVTVNSSGLVVLVNNPSTCIGQTAQLIASGATTYNWTGGLAATATPPTPALTTTTTYTVTGTTSGCTGSAVATVTVNPNLTISVNSPTICSGKTASLIASGATLYTWTGGLSSISNPTTPVLSSNTTYTVTGTTNGCSGTAVSTVAVLETKITNISEKICQGQSVTIGNQTFSANGNYTVFLQSSEGCDSTVNLSLIVNPLPVLNATSDLTIAKIDQQIQLNTTSSTINLSYNWTPSNSVNIDSIRNPIALITTSTVFTVMVTDNNNCRNTDSVFVALLDQCKEDYIFMPNAFTPNADGINDCFGILFPPKLSEFKMSIFNRWSELVFESENENDCWNGYFKGATATSDSYVYIVRFKCYNGVYLSKKGAVTLLR